MPVQREDVDEVVRVILTIAGRAWRFRGEVITRRISGSGHGCVFIIMGIRGL